MRLEHIKGTYDGIFSLGSKCLPAMRLKEHGLRPYSGVLDWMLSPSLLHVCRLLEMRFYGFMVPPNITFTLFEETRYLLYDVNYKITLAHDLALVNNVHDLSAFPEFRQKLERRIARFLNVCQSGQRLLFIRVHGTLEEVGYLQSLLSTLVRGSFTILLINEEANYTIVQEEYPLEHVCAIRMPLEILAESLWAQVLGGIHLSKSF